MNNQPLQAGPPGSLAEQEAHRARAGDGRRGRDRRAPLGRGSWLPEGQDPGAPRTAQDTMPQAIAGQIPDGSPEPLRTVRLDHAWGRWCW
jgi:hypothetical protein